MDKQIVGKRLSRLQREGFESAVHLCVDPVSIRTNLSACETGNESDFLRSRVDTVVPLVPLRGIFVAPRWRRPNRCGNGG